jgi:hypothetical protein
MHGLAAHSLMPGHEIRKGLKLARRFHAPHASLSDDARQLRGTVRALLPVPLVEGYPEGKRS